MFQQISYKFSNEVVSLWKKSIPGEISKIEQILDQILEISKMIWNDTCKVLMTSTDVKTTSLRANDMFKSKFRVRFETK